MTQNPPDPFEAPDPFEPPEAFDDPMLDALERSIADPPWLEDPLPAGPEDPAMLLDAAEAWVENTPSSEPAYEPDPLVDPLILPIEETVEGEIDTMEDPSQDSAAVEQQSLDQEPGIDCGPRITRSVKPPLAVPPRPGRSKDVLRRGPADRLTPRRQSIGRSGRGSPSHKSQTLILCPDRRELIYSPRDCESCEKFRHWPEGTQEEPRQCWFDWEVEEWLRRRSHQSDDGGEV